jgi:predicted anti-sigma-YlaC factor YlaD
MSSTLTCAEFLDLAAAVALDSAEPLDVERVESHAEECPECGRQLAAFREAGAALGTAVAQVDPSPSIKARLFEIVGNTPQERRRLWPRPWRLSTAWLAAAASFLFSIAAIAWVATLQGQIGTLQREAQADREQTARYAQMVDAMASNSNAIRVMQPVSVGMQSRGIVYLDPTSETGLVMCHNLPPIEQGHAYQIWFVRGNERISGGMLWPDRFGDGYTLIRVPRDLQSFDSVGLTDEPGAGSQWPTTPRVIGVPLKEQTQ